MGKKRMKKIQEKDWRYNLLHGYVDFVLGLSYRKRVYAGRENLPEEGAVIYAPNHTNALMDALVVLAMDSNPKVFVARADIFRNRRLAKIFTFLKIMPIMRQRDGFSAVKKNHETIEKAVDVLKDRIPFCIFPEGTHNAKYSSLPLSKGIFRIAFQAQELMPDTPLYIVPLGLRYGDFFAFRSTVRVEIGKPLNVREFLAGHEGLTQQEQMNVMREQLAGRMHSATFYIPDDENYDAVYEICNAAEPCEVEVLRKENRGMHSLDLQFKANKSTLMRMAALKESDPGALAELIGLGNEAKRLREAKGIGAGAVSAASAKASRMAKAAALLAASLYAVPATVLSLPVIMVCKYIFTKLKDPAFRNSVRFLMMLLLWPLLVVVYSVAAFLLLPWQWGIAAVLLALPAPFVAYEFWNRAKLAVQEFKLQKEQKLKRIYSRIREIVMR